MKWHLLFFMFFSVHAFALDGEVAAVKNAIAAKNPEAISQSLVALQLAVNDYELNDGSSYSNPSPARQQTRNEIKSAIAPIKADLVDLAASDSPAAGAAIVVLGDSDGGPQVYQTLAKIITETQSSDLASKAFFALSKTGLADDSVKDAVAQRISTLDPQDNTGSSVALGLLHEAAYVPVPEALDALIKILSTDDRTGAKISAANALMVMGPSGARALPELERQLALLKASNADFRDIKTMERTIRVVSGKMTKSVTTQPATDGNATEEAPSSSNPPAPASVAPASPQPTSPSIVASASSTNSGNGLVLLLIAVGILGVALIAYRVLTKKKS
jgi:hypothetical protein